MQQLQLVAVPIQGRLLKRNFKMKKSATFTVLALSWVANTAHTHADDLHPALSDTHTIRMGAYFQNSESKITARRNESEGRKLDLDDLGADDTQVSWLLAYRWRFAERWSLAAGASGFETNGDITTKETIEFNGVEYEAGAKLESDFSMNTYVLDIMYSIYRNDRTEVLLGGGIHTFSYDMELTGTLSLDDRSRSKTITGDDLLAPMPNFRIGGTYAFSPRWAVYGSLGWLSVNYDDWDGDYTYLNVRTDYRFGRHYTVGLGYQGVSLEIGHSGRQTESSIDASYHGPTLYMDYSF